MKESESSLFYFVLDAFSYNENVFLTKFTCQNRNKSVIFIDRFSKTFG